MLRSAMRAPARPLLLLLLRRNLNPNRPRPPRAVSKSTPAKPRPKPLPVHLMRTPPAAVERIAQDEARTSAILQSAHQFADALQSPALRRPLFEAQLAARQIRPAPLEPAPASTAARARRPAALATMAQTDPGALALLARDLPAAIEAAPEAESALAAVQAYVDAGGRPDSAVATALVRACMHAGQNARAWALFEELDGAHGVLWDVEGYATGMELCAKVRRAPRALQLLEMCELTLGKDAVPGVLHACMAATARDAGTARYALALYGRMTRELALVPTSGTLSIVLSACARLADETSARAYWDDMVASGDVAPDAHCYAGLLNCYARGCWDAMRKRPRAAVDVVALDGERAAETADEVGELLHKLAAVDASVVHNDDDDDDDDGDDEGALVPVEPDPRGSLQARQQRVRDCVEAAEALTATLPPATATLPVHNALCKTLASAMRLNRAEAVLGRIEAAGLRPDAHTYGTLIRMLARAQRVDRFLALEQRAAREGVALFASTQGAMLDALARNRREDDAVARLQTMRARGLSVLEKHLRYLRIRMAGERADLLGPDPNRHRSPKVVGRMLREVDASAEAKRVESMIANMARVGNR